MLARQSSVVNERRSFRTAQVAALVHDAIASRERIINDAKRVV
jgi:hypothetical protein